MYRKSAPIPALCLLILTSAALAATPFTIVGLPDTQEYTTSATLAAIFTSQTQWVVDNQSAENIVFLTHFGDLIDLQSETVQWERADAAMDLLDNELPYGACMGNHDFGKDPNATNFKLWFGPSRYSTYSWYVGSSSNEVNHAQLIAAGDYTLLHISLRYNPTSADYAWAQGVLNSHPGLQAIITTHNYLNITARSGTGDNIWNTLVKDNPQVFMILCGHFHGENQQISVNNSGGKVIEMLADFQDDPNGGNGYLRVLRFDPDASRIYVQTYSPWLDQYQTDANSEFAYDVTFGSTIVVNGLSGGGNHAPVASNDSYGVDENETLTVSAPGVLSNDNDQDSDPLTAIKVSDPSHGTVSLSSNGSFTYTPSTGYYGSDSFTYKANDGEDDSNTATVNITVNQIGGGDGAFIEASGAVCMEAEHYTGNDPRNDPASKVWTDATSIAGYVGEGYSTTVAGGSTATYENGCLESYDITFTNTGTYTVWYRRYAVDTNSNSGWGGLDGGAGIYEGQPTYNVWTWKSLGTVSVSSAGSHVFYLVRREPGYSVDRIYLTKNGDTPTGDGPAESAREGGSQNNAPVAVNDSYSTNQDTPLTVSAPGVLGNDTDGDSDPLTAIKVSDPSHGTVSLSSNGGFTYTPSSGYYGSDSFTYKANDGTADSNTATVSITVNQVGGQQPYNGSAFSLPGLVQAEEWDLGGEGVAYHDTTAGNTGNDPTYRSSEDVDVATCTDSGGGRNIGTIATGEWLEYTVNVGSAGTYNIEVRVATPNSGKTMHIEFDGVNKTGTINIPNTGGYQTWQTVTVTGVSLSAGQQVMRVAFDSASFNVNWVNVVSQ